MMEGIINDAKVMEQEAIRAEDDEQEAYEEFVKDSNDSIEEKMKDLTNKQDVRAKKDKTRVDAKVDHDQVVVVLDNLSKEAHDLHISCDFLLNNFDVRVQARDEEIEALKQGIAMFSGAHFSAFAQNYVGPF